MGLELAILCLKTPFATSPSQEIMVTFPAVRLSVGAIVDQVAASHALPDYQARLAPRTKRRQEDDLTLFATYLGLCGIQTTMQALMSDIATWQPVTDGLVSGFLRYQLQADYAIGSINVRLTTVKRYCSVATEAHVIDPATSVLIARVKGYSHKDGRNIDREREVTRLGAKKAEAVVVSKEQAARLKREQPDTAQGWCDALLMCLLLDHGLRCGEIALLTRGQVNLSEEKLIFYREKVDLTQTHELTKDTRAAMRRYLEYAKLEPGDYLLRGSRRSGKLEGRMSERAITARVNALGERIKVSKLSAHDGRHTWATLAIKAGTDIKALQVAEGWKSPHMPIKYAEAGRIANEGVKLPE
jgi:integrase